MAADCLRHQVCTLEGTEKKWVGTQLKTVGKLGHAVAVGHCLAARLGYDRSGYARAVVPRKGMPLYSTDRDALRGTGTIEEREQLLGQKSVAARAAPKLDPATCERGDLIVKVPVKVPRDRTRPQRLCLVEGVLHLPPVVLLTSAPAIGAQRRGERLVPAAPLAVLFTHTLLPALLTLIAIRRRQAGVPVSAPPSRHSEALRGPQRHSEAIRGTVSAPSRPIVFDGSGIRVSGGALGSCGAVAASMGGAAGAVAGVEGGAAGACASAAGSLSIEAIEAIREALFASDIELADGMTRWRKVEVEAFFESGGDMSVVHRMREAVPATMETQGSVAALSPRAIRGTQRHSEAIRGTQRRSEAIRGTQRRSEALRGTQRHSEALSPRASSQASSQAVVAAALPQGQGQGAEIAPPLPMTWPADEAARDCLRAVLVRVGGESRSEPSAAACAVMRLLSSGLPQLRWTVVDMVRGVAELLPALHASAHHGAISPQVRGVAEPLLDDEALRIERAAFVLLEAAPDDAHDDAAPASRQLIFDLKLGQLVPVTPPPTCFQGSSEASTPTTTPRDETEEEEALCKESDTARLRAERVYLAAGRALARELLAEDPARALHRCHMNGGVLMALDEACALLGRYTPTTTPGTPPTHQRKERGEASWWACNGRGEAIAAGAALDAPGRRTGRAMGSEAMGAVLGTWPSLLPYCVGLAPPAPSTAPSVLSWRRLCDLATRDCAADEHSAVVGMSALGLPPGAVVAVLTDQRCKAREALGSAPPRRFSRGAILARAERVHELQRRRQVEVQRAKRLEELAGAYQLVGDPFPAPPKPNGPHPDHQGVRRGFCAACNGCPGYELPRCAHMQALLLVCAQCGCQATCHEAQRKAPAVEYH